MRKQNRQEDEKLERELGCLAMAALIGRGYNKCGSRETITTIEIQRGSET